MSDNAKNLDEMINSEGVEIPDEELDAVAGGYIFATESAFEVIDKQGNVLESFGFDPEDTTSVVEAKSKARTAAVRRGLSGAMIPWEFLKTLRG